jgi:hypothetical protein
LRIDDHVVVCGDVVPNPRRLIPLTQGDL